MEERMIVIKGGTIVDYKADMVKRADILVEGGRIREIAEPGTMADVVEGETIDAAGLHVVPGFIDLHVHLREPGFEWKEDIESGTMAAVAGGFTSVVCMANTDPVNDCPEVTRLILEKAEKAGHARVYPVAAVTRGLGGKELTDFGELIEAGAVSFSDDGRPVMNSQVMMRAMDYAKMFGARMIMHEEDSALSAGGVVNDGEISSELGLPPLPAVSEEILISRDILLAEYTGAPIHIAHVSTRGGVELIRNGKERGIDVTAETAPHYLVLTEEDVRGFNTRAKMNPPLRRCEDREALVNAIIDGTIDCIATDHAPHEELTKNCEFQAASFGIIGLQTAFPLILEVLSKSGKDVKHLVKLLSYNPSKLLNIDGGSIRIGGPADLAILDLERTYNFDEEMILSKSRNSPFIGRRMKGAVVGTVVGGVIKYRMSEELGI